MSRSYRGQRYRVDSGIVRQRSSAARVRLVKVGVGALGGEQDGADGAAFF
jgi:hypothetical protein